MPDEQLSLADLAGQSGVELRTLRSWIQQGLVPRPDSLGRNARYAASALTRARAVRAMRDIYGMSIQSIRQELIAADNDRLVAYSAMADGDPVASHQQSVEPPAGSTAADYLKALRATGVFGNRHEEGVVRAGQPPVLVSNSYSTARSHAGTATSRLRSVIERLERAGGRRPVSPKAQGEARLHFPVTPDIELTVRGELTPDEITQFQQIADLLRDMLTGADTHE